MGYAFISYSTKNQSSADAMRNLFKKHNIDTWMAPYDIPVGSEYTEILHDALIGCSCLVLMLTDASQNSTWVKKEVNVAITNGKTIIPVKLEDIELNKSMTMYLVDQQIIPVHVIDEKSEEIQKVLNRVLFFAGETKETETTPIPPVTPTSKNYRQELGLKHLAEWVIANGIPSKDNRYYYKTEEGFGISCNTKSNIVTAFCTRTLNGLSYSVTMSLRSHYFKVLIGNIGHVDHIDGVLNAKYYTRKSSLVECLEQAEQPLDFGIGCQRDTKQILDLCIGSLRYCLQKNHLPFTIADLGFESFE